MRKWIWPGVLFVGVVSLGASEPNTEPKETVEAFHAALASGDKEGALAHLAEDVVIFESGGAEMSRAEYASHHMGGDMKFTAATRREVSDQAQTIDGDVAWVLTRSKTTGSYRDREIDSRGTETMVLKRSDVGWKVVHIHWSSRNER